MIVAFAALIIGTIVAIAAGTVIATPKPEPKTCDHCGVTGTTRCFGLDLCGTCAVEEDRRRWP